MSVLKASKKASVKTEAKTLASGHWQSRSALWLGLALTLALLSTVGAFQQAPHRNAYRPAPKFLSWDYWGYPVERNAFRRLPAIAGNLNDLAVSDDGQHIWAVGSGGLIVYSQDGGVSWQQGRIGPPPAEALPRASSFWINEAQAGMPPERQQQYLPAPDAGNSIPNVSNSKSDYANAQVRQELPVDPKTQTTQSFEQSKDLPAIKSNALPKQTFDNTVSEPAPDKKTPATVDQAVAAKQKAAETDPKSTDLKAVAFTDTLLGWAVGNEGVILNTTDGGRSWQIQRSGTNRLLKFADIPSASEPFFEALAALET
jgi:hypothetical protein